MQQPRGRQRGTTLIETLAATAVMTVLGGTLMVLTTSARNVFWADTTLTELSGYLDASTEQLKKDIWKAVDAGAGGACPTPAGPLPIGVTQWLCLDMGPANPGVYKAGDVRYIIQNPPVVLPPVPPSPDVRLIRQVYNGAAWTQARTMAHYVQFNAGALPTVAVAGAPSKGKLVTFGIAVQKSAVGIPPMKRSIAKVKYHLQTP